jgi:hypothetical protein
VIDNPLTLLLVIKYIPWEKIGHSNPDVGNTIISGGDVMAGIELGLRL